MPGKNKIALFGMGGVGGACAKALLASEADCLGLREAIDVPQIDIETLRNKRPFVIMEKEQYDVLGPVRLKNLEQKYGISFLHGDFKKKNRYLRSIQLSKEYGMYRQEYCGCIFSKLERERKQKEREKNG